MDYQKAFRLDGKVALVTGAARGLGREIAQALAAMGASVAVSDILDDGAKATVELLRASGAQARGFVHNVTDEAQWQATIAGTIEAFGGIDILVNNAGVESGALLAACTVEDFRRIQDVNVTGTFLGCKHAIQAMSPGGASGRGGSIVNLSSAAGMIGVIAHGA